MRKRKTGWRFGVTYRDGCRRMVGRDGCVTFKFMVRRPDLLAGFGVTLVLMDIFDQ